MDVMHSAVTEAGIHRASAQFWEQMLAMELEPVESSGMRSIGVNHMMGSCDLAGAWSGCVEVRLSQGLAMRATAAMLMQSVDAVQAGDILDATKEIANMIAGIFKSALPRPCTMTIPHAEAIAEDFCVLPRTADSVAVFFRHDSGALMIRVCEAELCVAARGAMPGLECAVATEAALE
jgi:CheY-specific phosphatase CheX